MWVVVKIMVPFWVPNVVRHLLFRVPKRDPNFDNYPCGLGCSSPEVTGCVRVEGFRGRRGLRDV